MERKNGDTWVKIDKEADPTAPRSTLRWLVGRSAALAVGASVKLTGIAIEASGSLITNASYYGGKMLISGGEMAGSVLRWTGSHLSIVGSKVARMGKSEENHVLLITEEENNGKDHV